MKKVLFLLLASFLVLAACGGKEEGKSEDKKETKSSSKNDKKKDENKKSHDDKKEESDKKETDNTDDTQQANTEPQNQNVEQPQSTEEPMQSQEQAKPVEQEPTDQEKMKANAKVAKENGYTGIPNGDAMSDVPVGQIDLPPDELAKEEDKPEYQDVVETEEEADARIGLNE